VEKLPHACAGLWMTAARLARPRKRPAEASPAERRRRRRADQQRRHRRRQRDGTRVYSVEVDDRVLEMLVRLRWLPESAAGDPREVAAALGRLLADSAAKNNS
jgi:hypothetical protein